MTAKTRTPNTNSLRAKLLAHLAENPGAIVSRQELVEKYRVGITAVENAVHILKRDGYITALRQPDRTVGYVLVGTPLVACAPKAAKPIRNWSATNFYQPPRPIANSIFNLAASMGVT